MPLLEETVSDRTGRVVNTPLADYVVAANADVCHVDVLSEQRVSGSSPSPG